MADTQAESPDSRTSVVGRKRDLYDSMLYREGADNGDSDEERSHKRVKETHLPTGNTNSEPNPASYLAPPLQESAEVEPSDFHGKPFSESSREESDKVPEPAKQSILESVGDRPDVSQAPAEVLNNAIPTTWNQGIQSGLRTSFGSKSKRRSRLGNSNSIMGDGPDNSIDPTSPTLQEDPMQVDDTSRSSDDKNDVFMDNGKSSTNMETQALSAQQEQIEVLSSQDLPTHQEPQHRISEARSQPEDDTRDMTNAREDAGPLRTDPSSSKEDESHGEGNSNDSTAELGGLPGSPTSQQPKKFRKLSKREFRFLSAPEKEAYELEAAAHRAKVQDSRVHTARRALIENRPDKPLKKLSSAALELLNPQEREEYLTTFEAKKLERQRKTFEEVTRNATEYLTNGSNNSTILGQINNGFTFYPRKCSPAYQKNKVKFPLSEVLEQGKPIHIERFSFNVFAPAFLAAHRTRRHLISQKNLIAAFHLYINTFYSHVLQFGFADRLRATATASDALTMEQAKCLADMGLLPGPSNDSPTTNGGGQGTASSSLLPSEDGVEQSTTKDDDIAMGDVAQAEAKDLTDVERTLPEDSKTTDFVIDEAEIYLQQKYFPGTASTIRRCLSCGHLGHYSSTCPALACTSCSTFGKHPTASCPLNARCGKCRERGHLTKDCPEKLSRSRGEAVPCDLCGSQDHLEMACSSIWRSYNPKPEEICTVQNIPAHCYMCGKDDHYGPECGLYRGRLLSGGSTWSRGNLQKYVDPASQNRALSAGVDYTIPPRSSKQFSIKGKANDPIELDESDDGEDFIRPKVKPPVQSGNIRFRGQSGRVQGSPVNVSYRPAQPPQHGFNRPSGPPPGMQPRSMAGPPGPPGPRGSNNGGGGKKGPNIKKRKDGPPEAPAPSKRRRRHPKA